MGSRRTWSTAAALVGALVLAACSQGGNDVRVDVDEPSDGTSSPSASPSEGASDPATGLPSTEATSAGPPKVVSTVATGLRAPWGLDFLPDGTAVVTERDTRKVLLIGGDDQHEVTTAGTIEAAAPTGEAGLLGVLVSEDFSRDRLLYFYASTADDNRILTAKLGKQGRLSRPTAIFTGIPNGFTHDGGRMEWGPDGYLYVSTGESGESALAQDRDSLGGKILRLTAKGKPAPGNPFDSPVWSVGHRNVQGLAFVDDQLWASEFGQDDFDELNRIRQGKNYGWPEVEGTGGTSAGFVDPAETWSTDDASPSGLAYAAGSLWMAALKGERLWRVPVSGGKTTKPTGYFVGDYGRMRTVAVAPDGNLWVMTSNRDGRGDPKRTDDRILEIRP